MATSVNCGSSGSGSPGTAGSSGSSGSAGHAGTTGVGGTGTGTGGSGTGTGGTLACGAIAATAADMTILDFNAVPTANLMTSAAFGGYMVGVEYGGGTYLFPNAMMTTDGKGLSNDFSGMTWHLTGLVKDYAGFGLYLASTSDVSMFGGIQFDISGTYTVSGTGDGGAPPTAQVTLSISDVAHAVDSLHTADGSMTCGTCAPTTSQYDGTCAAPSKVIPITNVSATQTFKWTDLNNGKRPPNLSGESPDPTKILGIAWALPWAGDGSIAQYNVDITIDNIKYIPKP